MRISNVLCPCSYCGVSRKGMVSLFVTAVGMYFIVLYSYAKSTPSVEYIERSQPDQTRQWTIETIRQDWRNVSGQWTDKDPTFRSYLEAYEDLCEKTLTRGWQSGADERSNTPLCPCVSGLLTGRRVPNVAELHSLSWPQVRRAVGELGPGGHWRPTLCRPRLRLAVIIPYRDREKDLRAQIATLYPILQHQLAEFRVFVVEQSWPGLYNKGAMLDVGYLEAAKRWRFDCVLFQDVDLIMEDDRNIIHCIPDKPLHLGAYLDEQNYKLKYKTIVGGALSFTRQSFLDLNGYTQLYFGWGGEDDNMKGRINKKGWTLARPNLVARYTHIKNLKRGDPSNPVDKYSRGILGKKKYNIDPTTDGLNSVKYNVSESVEDTLFTWINIALDVKSQYTYNNRATFTYTVEPPSECERETLLETDVSFTTCKYLCDERTECGGFILLRNPDIVCILKTKCGTGKSNDTKQKGSGQFYLKQKSIKELDELDIRDGLSYKYPHPSNER